jgi:hypothetical protein
LTDNIITPKAVGTQGFGQILRHSFNPPFTSFRFGHFVCSHATKTRIHPIKFTSRYSIGQNEEGPEPLVRVRHMDIDKLLRDRRLKDMGWWCNRMGVDAAPKIASFVRGEPCERGFDDEGQTIREGTFHQCHWVQFADGIRWVVRFPLPSMLSWDMVNDNIATQVATLMFLTQRTSIPVPTVISYGLEGGDHPPACRSLF